VRRSRRPSLFFLRCLAEKRVFPAERAFSCTRTRKRSTVARRQDRPTRPDRPPGSRVRKMHTHNDPIGSCVSPFHEKWPIRRRFGSRHADKRRRDKRDQECEKC
jgi:hypothetical protein